MEQTLEVKGLLSDLFPVDHPATPWLLRLMIIRDDVDFEFRNLWLDKNAGPEESWRCTYFIRRMTVSLMEALAVLACEGGKESKRAKDEVMVALGPHVRDTTEALEEAARLLEPVRNAVGAHLRPQNVDPKGGSVEARVIKNCPKLQGEARVCLEDLQKSSYRSLTVNSLAFVWPEVQTDEEYVQRLRDLRDGLLTSVQKVIGAIDGLLVRHWWNLGRVNLPEGYDLAIPDLKTGKPHRLTSGSCE